jgi:predicted GNAT family acetyltransferase
MEITKVSFDEVESVFSDIKPDLLDRAATYYAVFIKGEMAGIVSYVEHPSVIYLCHAFVREEYRNRGLYKLLWEYRNSKISDSDKVVYAHCNVDSLKHFINNGYTIEKALFKVVKKKI